jgi:divalent metal cation (Fe/Co/Zn/Cd) transporter
MDRTPDGPVTEQIAAAASSVAGVQAIEKLMVRKFGTDYFVDLHVQADPMLTLREAHNLSGRVKGAIRSGTPGVSRVLIHMEPHEEPL